MKFLKSALAALPFAILAASASAQQVTFNFDNEFNQDVAIEFYSTDRDHVWPGGDEVFVLGASDGVATYPLQCNPGEQICFGAWTQDQRDQWGVGIDMSLDCQACCAVCDGTKLDLIELF